MVIAVVVIMAVVGMVAAAWRGRRRRGQVGSDSYGGVEDFRRAMDAIAPEHDDRDR